MSRLDRAVHAVRAIRAVRAVRAVAENLAWCCVSRRKPLSTPERAVAIIRAGYRNNTRCPGSKGPNRRVRKAKDRTGGFGHRRIESESLRSSLGTEV